MAETNIPYDEALQAKMMNGVGDLIHSVGGITATTSPQILEALALIYCQVAIQYGFVPDQFAAVAEEVKNKVLRIMPGLYRLMLQHLAKGETRQ